MDDREQGLLTRLLIVVVSTTVTWWVMQPEHRQRELKMRAALAAQQKLQALARRIADRAMRQELRNPGTEPGTGAGRTGYALAHDLMTGPVERAARWYESLRSTS